MPTFRIISFDGGGIKGALSTRILKRLYSENKDLIQKTNLFAGTSTGALISLALASGISVEEIDNMYCFDNLKTIFSKRHFNLFRPKFKNDDLKELIMNTLPKDATLKDLKKLVFIPAFHLKGVTRNHWQGVFFNNINNTFNHKLVDVALASSAAPTYFPSHNDFIDGGIITNSPSIASIITVIHELPNKYKLNDFKVLSIGTGETPRKISSNTSKWGIFQWSIRPFSSVKLPLTSVLLNDTLPLEDLYAKELLKNNFKRVNPIIPFNVEIDDYTKVNELKDIANKMDLTETNDFINNIFLK